MCSNPFLPRRNQFRTSVPPSVRPDNETQQQKRARRDKERASESRVFSSIYGDSEILGRVQDLTAKPRGYPTYTTAIRAPVPPDPVPLAQLRYDPDFYEFDPAMAPARSARVVPIRPHVPKEGTDVALERMRRAPLPRLVIPAPPSIADRPHKDPTPRRRSVSVEAPSPPLARHTSQAIFKNTGDFLNESQAIVGCFLPLHMFDDESYDDGVRIDRPPDAWSPYTFD
jgi:hypothetical protein